MHHGSNSCQCLQSDSLGASTTLKVEGGYEDLLIAIQSNFRSNQSSLNRINLKTHRVHTAMPMFDQDGYTTLGTLLSRMRKSPPTLESYLLTLLGGLAHLISCSQMVLLHTDDIMALGPSGLKALKVLLA